MNAALSESGPGRFVVRRIGFQRDPGGAITERDRDGLLVFPVERVVTGFAIQGEIVDGILLALRPQAFAADIGAHRGQDIEAQSGQAGLKQDNGDERRNQPQQREIRGFRK